MKLYIFLLVFLCCLNVQAQFQPSNHKHWGVVVESGLGTSSYGDNYLLEDEQLLSCWENNIIIRQLPDTSPQVWASIGAAENTHIKDMYRDNQGNIYIVGHTSLSEGLTTSGVYKTDFDWDMAGQTGGVNGFIAKFNDEGGLIWCTYSEKIVAGGVVDSVLTADDEGNVYYVAMRSDTDVIANAPFQSSITVENFSANGDAPIISKLNSAGQLVWQTFFSYHSTMIFSIDTTDNRLVVTGRFSKNINYDSIDDPEFFSTTGAMIENPFQGATNGIRAFVNVFDFDGTRDWGTYLTNQASNSIRALRIYEDKLYVLYDGGGLPVLDNPYMSAGGTLLSKFDEEGNYFWSTYTHSSGFTIDEQERIYLFGWTTAMEDFVTEEAFQLERNPGGGANGYDAFHHIIQSDGSEWVYGTYYGYDGNEQTLMIWPTEDGYISYEDTWGNTDEYAFITEKGGLEEVTDGTFDGRVLSKFSTEPLSNESPILENVTLYPNPVTDMLFIEHTESFITSDSIEVYNALGQRILEKNNLSTHQVVSINTSTWRRGYYLVKIKSANKIGVYKVFKK